MLEGDGEAPLPLMMPLRRMLRRMLMRMLPAGPVTAVLTYELVAQSGVTPESGDPRPPRDPSRDPRAFPPRHAPYSMHTISLQVAVYSS